MSPGWDTTPRAELGVCVAPDLLVPGDADAMRSFAGRLRRVADGAARVGWLLARVDAGALLGQYGAALRTRLAAEPAPYQQVALALTVAADAVDELAATIEDARQVARQAVEAYGDADLASAQWQAARDSVGAGVLGGLAGDDPGQAGRQSARRLLAGAQDDLAATVQRTCRVLREVAAAAPQPDRGVRAGAVDTWRGILGMPARVLSDPAGAARSAWHSSTHPIDTLSDAIDDELDTMRRTPDEWAGGMLSTAGLGAAAGAAGKIVKRADVHTPPAGPVITSSTHRPWNSGGPRIPASTFQHVLRGEFTGKKPHGYHHRPGGVDLPGRESVGARLEGPMNTYRIEGVVFTRADGKQKVKRRSTFFPDAWSEAEVRAAITQAWQGPHRTLGPNRTWIGVAYNGLQITGYVDADDLPSTGYPYIPEPRSSNAAPS